MSEQTPSVENTVQNTAPRAATLQELKAELVGASSDFLLAQLEASATLPQASKAWIAELSAQNKAAAEARAAAEAKVAELEKKKPLAATKPGVDPLPTAATEGQSPENAIAAWESLVEAELKAMGKTQPTKLGSVTPRMRAQIAAAKKNPAAHAAYLVAHNTRKRAEYPNRNWNAMQLSPAAAIAADPASV